MDFGLLWGALSVLELNAALDFCLNIGADDGNAGDDDGCSDLIKRLLGALDGDAQSTGPAEAFKLNPWREPGPAGAAEPTLRSPKRMLLEPPNTAPPASGAAEPNPPNEGARLAANEDPNDADTGVG